MQRVFYGLGLYALLIGVLFLCVLCFIMPAKADKTIGLGLSQSVDGEFALGLQGEWDSNTWDIDYDYQGIDFHDAKVNVSYRFELGLVDGSIFQENDWTGYTLGNMNRTNDLGISAIVHKLS